MKIQEIADQSRYIGYLDSLNPKTHHYIKARSAEMLSKRFPELSWDHALKLASKWLLQIGKDHVDHSTYAAIQRGEMPDYS